MTYASLRFKEVVPAVTREDDPVLEILVDGYPFKDKRLTPVVYLTQKDSARIEGTERVFDAMIEIAGDQIEAVRDYLTRVIEESKADAQ